MKEKGFRNGVLMFLLILFQISNCIGQDTLKLSIANFQPRQFDEVNFTLDIDFLTNLLEGQVGNENKDLNPYYYGASFLNSQLRFGQFGKYKIGPFRFSFENKEYVTDSIEIKVDKALPEKEGIWLRYVKFQGKSYVFLEQQIKGEFKSIKSGYNQKEHRTRLPENGQKFAEIIENPKPGVNFLWKYAKSKSTIPISDWLSENPGYIYSLQIYEIEYTNPSIEKLVVGKDYITNLPEKIKVKALKITR